MTDEASSAEPWPGGARPVGGALGHWLAVRMVIIMCVTIVGVLLLSHQALSALFDEFEQAATLQHLARVQSALQQDGRALGEVVQDYAQWDDAHRFVLGQQPGFMADNFTSASLRNLRLDAVLVVDEHGRLLGDLQNGPSGLLPHIQPEWLQPLVQGSTPAMCASTREGGVWVGDTPLMLARKPISNTAGDAPPVGCLVFVREIDAAYLTDMEQFSGIRIVLSRQQGVDHPSLAQQADGVWVASTALPHLTGSLSVHHQSQLGAQRGQIMTWLMLALVLVMVLAVGVLYALVQRKVVSRLRLAAALADGYRRTPGAPIVWPDEGVDEIDRLGRSLNELVSQVQAHQHHAAHHDVLTGLSNRRGLEAALASVPFASGSGGAPLACLVLLDLDNFKTINDGFGQDVGDALLCRVARQLEAIVRSGDTTARTGGDEFALLLHGLPRDQALALVTTLMEQLRWPLVHGDMQVATSGSVGLAFSDSAHNAQILMRQADLAMYQAKQRGRNCWVVFNEALHVEAQRRSRLAQSLRRALDDGLLQVAFQPVLDARTNRVTSMEALARWSLDGEVISPAEFIPIAEENGLIGRLGMQVVDRSCALLARLGALGHDVSCSVNLSVRQFTEFNLQDDVPRRVAAHGLAPSALRLEVTESLVADAESTIVDTMHALHAQGFDFLLDDFGTGHSSLHRLQQLPFQTLKIDRSFVAPLQQGDQVMVRTVVDLAKALRLDVVAEGVETPEQLLPLLELGVTHLQGYLLARPMSDEALVLWLETLKRQGGGASAHVAAWLASSNDSPRAPGEHIMELATVV